MVLIAMFKIVLISLPATFEWQLSKYLTLEKGVTRNNATVERFVIVLYGLYIIICLDMKYYANSFDVFPSATE